MISRHHVLPLAAEEATAPGMLAPQAADTNLLPNPGLEEVVDGLPAQWTPWNSASYRWSTPRPSRSTVEFFGFDPVHALVNGSTAGDLRILFQGAGATITQDRYGSLYVPYGSTRLLRITPG